MIYDVKKERINELGSNGIRNLKKRLDANLVDTDRVGNVLSDITSRIDLRQEDNKKKKLKVEDYRIKKTKKTRKKSNIIRENSIKPKDDKKKFYEEKVEKVENEKVEKDKIEKEKFENKNVFKEIENSKNGDNNQNKKLKLEDFSNSDLKALKRTLIKESKQNEKVLNDLINTSNNPIKGLEEIEILSKSKNAKRKFSGCEQNLVFKSYSQLDLNKISRLIETSEKNHSKDEVEKPELMCDLKKKPLNYDLKKTNIEKVVDFDHLLEEKYTIHGLEGTKKEIMNYSEMMSSKLDSMLENLQSDVGRIVRKTKNYDHLSKHSPFSLEHIQDTHCDLFSIDIKDSSSLPLNFNSSAHQGISTLPSCMANSSYLPARTTNRFYLDTNDSSAPIDINNSNCASYNVQGNRAYFDSKAAKRYRQNQVRDMTVEKVRNCFCEDYEQKCQPARGFQMPTKPSGSGGKSGCCPKPLSSGGGGRCCCSNNSCCDGGCCSMPPCCGSRSCCSTHSCCDGKIGCCCPRPRCCCGGGGCCSKPMGCSVSCCPMPSCCGGGCCPSSVCCCGGDGFCPSQVYCCGKGCGCEVNHCPLCCSCDTTDIILCRSCGCLTPKPKCLGCITLC